MARSAWRVAHGKWRVARGTRRGKWARVGAVVKRAWPLARSMRSLKM